MKDHTLNRQVDLDWIRVIATVMVFLYHCSMFFNPFDWHVKNNVINTSYILVFTLLVGTWIMPIFFAISGITTFHALKKRNMKGFVKERCLRLGIPLLFGVFVLTPPQVYIERITNQQFRGTFFEFFPHYFDGVYLEFYGTGNFAFFGLHLWYLLVLLIFSLLSLPILTKIKVADKFSLTHYVLFSFILFILSVFVEIVNLGGWGLPFYFVIYLVGYIYFSQDSFRNFYRKNGLWIGFIALLTSVLYIYWFLKGMPKNGTLLSLCFTYLKVLNGWNWLIFIFYLGNKYLAAPKKGLKYVSQASMPFYVLHQPIIVSLGFYLYQQSWNIPSKLLFLCFVSFGIIMFLYHFVIQRVYILRVLFGLKGTSHKGKEIFSPTGISK
ncbi:acyltransferase family protein [Neobacillus sp. D3-1R]|uniref:acyltransferase family protein n=1 Tax=Neobacillus sp. D3-1R TaxID=3445778 RepID=UPI003FA123D0